MLIEMSILNFKKNLVFDFLWKETLEYSFGYAKAGEKE